MSKENLEQFMNQVADSEELQARIGDEIDADSLIALGAEHGCDFSAEDLTAGAELSDEELDGVAGGAQNSYLTMQHGISLRITGVRSRLRGMPQIQLDDINWSSETLHNNEYTKL